MNFPGSLLRGINPVEIKMNPVSKVRFRLRLAASVICLASLLPACNILGCKYVDVPGKATITRIANAEGGHDGKVAVTFDFQADDPQNQKSPHHSMPNTFTEEVSKQEFDVKHPVIGQKYQAVRSDITQGTCTPAV